MLGEGGTPLEELVGAIRKYQAREVDPRDDDLRSLRAGMDGLESEFSAMARRAIAENSLSRDRKSTRLNSSHQIISYAVFCLKKKKKNDHPTITARFAYPFHPPSADRSRHHADHTQSVARDPFERLA